MKDIVYDNLTKNESRDESSITVTIAMGQRIILERYVIEHWKLKEEIEEIYTLTFRFRWASRKHNMLNNCSYYQVQRNAAEIPVLVRVSE